MTTEDRLKKIEEKIDALARATRWQKPYLTTHDAAEYLGMSMTDLMRKWPSWIKQYGVNPIREEGCRRIKFVRADLDRMMEQMRVIRN